MMGHRGVLNQLILRKRHFISWTITNANDWFIFMKQFYQNQTHVLMQERSWYQNNPSTPHKMAAKLLVFTSNFAAILCGVDGSVKTSNFAAILSGVDRSFWYHMDSYIARPHEIVSAALLLMILSNFKTIWQIYHPIYRLQDFVRYNVKMSYAILKCPCIHVHHKIVFC